ncbi:hypothetical protein [Teichococcus aestuarii]|uniref:hypothetical protein n=1 Tax=Teichococcus aestuarii TaxID=568898 RepID=UPI003619B8B3
MSRGTGQGGMARLGLMLGLGFLWLPVLLLAGYAFSESRIPFQWGGFSLRWFAALAENERLLEAAGCRCAWRWARPRWRCCWAAPPAGCWRGAGRSAAGRCSACWPARRWCCRTW